MASSPVSALDTVEREILALPDGAVWVRGALLKRLVTALVRDRARAGTNVDEVPTDKGRFFCAQAGGAAAVTVFPWMPYASAWQGTGNDPHASTRVLRFRLARGKFATKTPANMMDEFLAFGDAADTQIEEKDAVYTQIYLQVPVSEDTLGSGQVSFDAGQLKIVEGDDLADAIGEVPEFGADGSVPAYIVVPIGEVAWWGGALHYLPGARSYLDCSLVISGTDCDHAGRTFIVSGAS